MRIGIIGAGWLGGTVGELLVKAGHEVMFSSRHPEKYADLTRRLGPKASAGTPREAAAHGEVVLIAVPYRELAGVGEQLGDALAGKIVIDACNPYPPDPDALIRAVEKQGVALASAERLPGVRLVRAFSSVDATEIERSGTGRRREPLGVPLASDDEEALGIVEQLVRDAGCAPVVAGPLAEARGFQRGGPAFRNHVDATELRRLLGL